MQQVSKLTGREYHPFTYYGAPDAENIILAMASITETTKEVIDYLLAKGEKVGLLFDKNRCFNKQLLIHQGTLCPMK